MGRLLKIVLIVVVSVIGLAFIAGLIFSLTFDPNKYREDIISAIETSTGREAAIDGDLGLSIFPWLAVEIAGVRLGNAEGFDQDVDFLSLDSARLSIQLLPALLQDEIRVGTAQVDGLKLNLQVSESGRTNWDDLSERQDAADAVQEPTDSPVQVDVEAEAAKLEVAGMSITNSSLSYRDAQSGSSYTLSDITLETGKVAYGEPIDLSGSVGFDVQPDNISGTVGIEFVLASEDSTIVISGLGIDGQVNGVADVPATLGLVAERIGVDIEKQVADLGTVELSAMNVNLLASIKPFSYAGSPTPEASIEIEPFSPRSLMSTLGIEQPETADPDVLENVSVKATADVSDSRIALTGLTLVVDDTTMTGELSAPRDSSGRYRFDLAADTIDLSRYMAPATESDGEGAAIESGPVEIPVDLIRAFNVTGTMTLAEALFGNMVFTDMELGVNSTDGVLRMHPITASFFDGGYQGDINVDASGDNTTLSVNERIENVSLAPLAAALFDQQNITGQINGVFRLSGTGADIDAIRKDLDGNLSFTLSDGAYEGTDVWYQLRKARATLRRQEPPVPSDPPRTPFSEVRANGVVTNGVMQNDDFLAELPFLQLSGRGSVNFVEASVNYTVTARVIERPEFVGDTTEEELAEFTKAVIPLRITGPLADPSIKPDFEEMFKDRARQEVKDRILDRLLGDETAKSEEGEEGEEGEEEDVEDALKDKLKDLFKR